MVQLVGRSASPINNQFRLRAEGHTEEKPPQPRFRLEGIGVLPPDLSVPMDDGKEREIGDEVTNRDSIEQCQRKSKVLRSCHAVVRLRDESKADLRGTEAPLLVHGRKGLEKCEDEGVAEAAE